MPNESNGRKVSDVMWSTHPLPDCAGEANTASATEALVFIVCHGYLSDAQSRRSN